VIIALKAILSRLKKGTKGRMRRARGEAGIIKDCEFGRKQRIQESESRRKREYWNGGIMRGL
jgi:hypothetical protein